MKADSVMLMIVAMVGFFSFLFIRVQDQGIGNMSAYG